MLLSLLLVGGLGAVLRWLVGKQPWYWGVLFFIVAYPVSLIVLLMISLQMGIDATPASVGTEAWTGALVGALFLSSSLMPFGSGEKKQKPTDTSEAT